jgi:hypothetical protein
MKFTIILPSPESRDLSFGVVFVPCICWVRGDRVLLNPHPREPHYQAGDLQVFLDETGTRQLLDTNNRTAAVVVHPAGHGTEADLALLLGDLREGGFEPSLLRL